MCGIAGIVSDQASNLRPIASMTRALRHRGPDDEGMLLGASCYADLSLARAAAQAGADYVAFGAVCASPTKPQARRAASTRPIPGNFRWPRTASCIR